MNEIPEIKRYAAGDRLHVQAQQIWLILVAHIMCSKRDPENPSTITYGKLAKRMGYDDKRAGHMLGRQLGIVGDYCKRNRLPTLNSIVVTEATKVPGKSVVLRKGWSVDDEQADCMREDWFGLRIPTTGTLRKVWEAMK
jgi:hypothetical protein